MNAYNWIIYFRKKINPNKYLHVSKSKFLNSTMNSLISIFPIYVFNIYFYIFYIIFIYNISMNKEINHLWNLLYTITASEHYWKS